MGRLKPVVLVAILFATAAEAAAEEKPRISLTLDFAQADAVISALDAGEISDADLQVLQQLYGSQEAIQHSAQFDTRVSDETWRAGLLAAIDGEPLDNDPLRFNRLYASRAESKILLDTIRKDPGAFTQGIEQLIRPYLPDGVSLEAKIYLVAGSNSSGWTDRKGEFFLDVRAARDDYPGLVYLAAHELYHLVLWDWMPAPGTRHSTRYRRVESLLLGTLNEGMAEHVVDFSRLGPGAIADINQRIDKRNARRQSSNFALFDIVLFHAFNSEFADANTNDLILLSGLYDEIGYYIGGRMLGAIEAVHGRDALLELMHGPPTQVFLAYQALTGDDTSLPRFNAETVAILQTLDDILARDR